MLMILLSDTHLAWPDALAVVAICTMWAVLGFAWFWRQ